jgi:cyclophilin family peptidyl-prolyl cis-trans isomerase
VIRLIISCSSLQQLHRAMRGGTCDVRLVLVGVAMVLTCGLVLGDLLFGERVSNVAEPIPARLRVAIPPDGVGLCAAVVDDRRYWSVAHFQTTRGTFSVQLRPDLAPAGVQHFHRMVQLGFFDDASVAFFRVNTAITQFGADEVSARPALAAARTFPHESKDRNPCGELRWALGTFAMLGGPQMIIVLHPNDFMGKNERDAPAGYVVAGMDVLNALYAPNDIIDNPRGGAGPEQGRLQAPGGRAYLKSTFPLLDWITGVQIERGAAEALRLR